MLLQQELLIGNISASIKAVTRSDIVQRQLKHFELVDPRLAAAIRKRLD
jgi:catalase